MNATVSKLVMFDKQPVSLELAFDTGQRQRWSHFLTQPAKVDSPMQRMIHHEDAETVFG